jgi:hypothetical protein
MTRELNVGAKLAHTGQSDEEVGLTSNGALGAAVTDGTQVSEELQTWKICVLTRLWCSMLFASYHTIVVGVFLGGVWYGVFSFFALTGLGLVFQWLLGYFPQQLGFWTIVSLHVGIDLGVIIALADSLEWIKLL